MVNKRLAHYLGSVEAAVLLADLQAKRAYFAKEGALDKRGGFFNTSLDLTSDLLITKEKRLKLIKMLLKAKLIKVEQLGFPRQSYYYIQDSVIKQVLKSEILNSLETSESGFQPTEEANCNNTSLPDFTIQERERNSSESQSKKKEQIVPLDEFYVSDLVRKIEFCVGHEGFPKEFRHRFNDMARVLAQTNFLTSPQIGFILDWYERLLPKQQQLSPFEKTRINEIMGNFYFGSFPISERDARRETMLEEIQAIFCGEERDYVSHVRKVADALGNENPFTLVVKSPRSLQNSSSTFAKRRRSALR
jgi:hypothetical protein